MKMFMTASNRFPGVSVSEIVNWLLIALITDIQEVPDEEFRKFKENDSYLPAIG